MAKSRSSKLPKTTVVPMTTSQVDAAQASLERAKAYRRLDPTFAKDFLRVAAAEGKYGKADPAEGVFFIEEGSSVGLTKGAVPDTRKTRRR